jgi:nucleoside-diphosphate-sugar epimerase
MRGDVLTVNGANETLDFTYVDDAADGIVAAALLDVANNRTYNITKSHSKTLLEAAELSVHIAGKGSIDVRGRDLDFPSRGALNIDAARRDLGYNPQVDMEEGFEIYHRWLSESAYWQQQLKV